MRIAKKIALWLLGISAAMFTLFVGLHVYYRLTPVELSEEAKALLNETAHMAELTENGYRMLGLTAPESLDAVAYGKCRAAAALKETQASIAVGYIKDADELASRLKPSNEAYATDVAACLQGGEVIRLAHLQREKTGFEWKPGFSWAQLKALPTSVPLAMKTRWEKILSSGTRGATADFVLSTRVMPQYQEPLLIEQVKLTEFANEWDAATDDAARARAAASLEQSVIDISKFASGTLIESMISLAAQSRQLLVLQAAAANQTLLSESIAAQLSVAAMPINDAPKALASAIASEAQVGAGLLKHVARVGSGFDYADYGYPRILNWLSTQLFDENDTMNVMAMGYRDSQQVVLAKGAMPFDQTRIGNFASSLGCSSLGEAGLLCLLFQRNPTGKITASIAISAYGDYGRRAWDVVNLANATRLTIEARRQGLQGDALAQFVANAPANMRDIYSQKPFVYDTATRVLTVGLKARSNVLGEISYELPL